jgi:L-iditol 2-dehydrogenase
MQQNAPVLDKPMDLPARRRVGVPELSEKRKERTMKVAAITGKQQGGLVDVADPKAADNYVVVKVHVTPMCTEFKMYRDGHATQCMGHEAAGEVVQVAQSGRVKVGDRVVVMPLEACGKCPLCLAGEYIHCQQPVDAHAICGCQTGTATYAQYLIKQDWMLVPIPDGMSYEHASMACCGLAPTFNAMKLMNVNSFDRVLVTGTGPVGLGAVVNAVFRGARVIVSELIPYRRELALKLGAAAAIDGADPAAALRQIMELTGGRGVDKAVDCSGAAAAQRLMIEAARRKGHASFVGEAGDLTIAVSRDMIRKGLTLHGIWHYNLADTPAMMRMIAAIGPQLDKHVTGIFPMRDVTKVWDLQMTGNCGKCLLHPWG